MFEWSVDAGLFKCAEKRIGVCFFQPLHVRHEGSRTYNSQKSLTDKTLLLLLSFVCQCIFIHPCLHPRVFSPAVALYPSLSVFFFCFFPSLCSAGQSSCFCSAQGLLHTNRMPRRVDEYLGALCVLRHHWQLCLTLSLEQRGCSRFFFFFFITFRVKSPRHAFTIW